MRFRCRGLLALAPDGSGSMLLSIAVPAEAIFVPVSDRMKREGGLGLHSYPNRIDGAHRSGERSMSVLLFSATVC